MTLQPRDPRPLADRTALVTGVSRRADIGYAIARRLLGYGARVVVHHYRPHDAGQPWGADPGGIEAVLDGLRATGSLAGDVAADLAEPDAPVRVIDVAVHLLGHLDVLVCNHARSSPDGGLGSLDAGILDGHWAVDARSTILAAITAALADQLADADITLNTVNPGPVDTGYLPPEAQAAVARRFPGGRWAGPDDPARLIAWLVTDEACSITGQVINSESGFRRWDPGPG